MDRTTLKFDSVTELAQWVDSNAEKAVGGDSRMHKSTMNYADTIKRALAGGLYPEGAENIEPVTLDADSLNARALALPVPQNSFAGYRANVPAYLSNSPLSMVRQLPQSKPNRLIKIGVQVGKQYEVSQDASYNRGNALLSCLNALHELGFAIELWALWRNHQNGGEVSIETCIKQANESYSPDSIAFAFCNDAYQRRLMWAAVDTLAHDRDRNALKVAYQKGTGAGADLSDFDISIEWMANHRHWQRVDSAVNAMLEVFKKHLSAMQAAA